MGRWIIKQIKFTGITGMYAIMKVAILYQLTWLHIINKLLFYFDYNL